MFWILFPPPLPPNLRHFLSFREVAFDRDVDLVGSASCRVIDRDAFRPRLRYRSRDLVFRLPICQLSPMLSSFFRPFQVV